MGSGSISKQLNENWRRAGVYGNSDAPTRNVSTTILRKSSSTAVLEHLPEVSKDVADLLLHSENTQKKYYDVRRREISSARGAKHVGNLLRFGSIYPGKECPPSVAPERPHTVAPESQPSSVQYSSASPRRKWSDAEIDEIKLIFADNIREKLVTMDMIRSMEKDFERLKGLPLRKSYDKIRSIWRTESSENLAGELETLREESLSEKVDRVIPQSVVEHNQDISDDFIPPSVSSSSLRNQKLFTTQQVELIKKLCVEIIQTGPISRSRIVH